MKFPINFATLIFVLASISGCRLTIPPPPISNSHIEALDPNGLVELYWDASLRGDHETIKKLVGPSGGTLLFECPPKRSVARDEHFEISNSKDRTRNGGSNENERGDKLEQILELARVLQIAGRPFRQDYAITERKISGPEAMFVIRPKKKSNGTNSLVIYMLHDSRRWRLIDVLSEGNLNLIGNKRFGEPRDCPSEP